MKRLLAPAVFLVTLAVPAIAHAAPTIARPNPSTYPLRLDYANPLRTPDGSTATLEPLSHAVIQAAVNDKAHLRYRMTGDLGGFTPAPVGGTALVGHGHNALATGSHKAEIPLFEVSAGGMVKSFTFTGTPAPPPGPPDNGRQPIPRIGIPPLAPPPTPTTSVPPANQGFGGVGGGGGGGGGTTTTRPTTTTPTTTTAPTTTTSPTTTASTTTTVAGGGGGGGSGGGGGGGGGPCGVPGLDIVSDHATCSIMFGNGKPGDAVHEVMTVTNTSGVPYDLFLEGTGPDNNPLWHDLQMAVWDTSGPPPAVFPSLDSWLTGFNLLDHLNPGDVRHYEIELFLPATVGNADMGLTVVVDFTWKAVG